MFIPFSKKLLNCSPVHLVALFIVAIVVIVIEHIMQKQEITINAFHRTALKFRSGQKNIEQYLNTSNSSGNVTHTTLSLAQINNLFGVGNDITSRTDSLLLRVDRSLETTVECVGPLVNQSCLYKNLYYVDSAFLVLTLKGRSLPPLAVRVDAFYLVDIFPGRREFDSYAELERFVRDVADPMVIPDLTLYFGQPWHDNVGHALFDGLYPAYVALIRFAPRHFRPFRLLVSISMCETCWTEDVYSRFAGLGIIKHSVLNSMSMGRWFMFDGLVMGSGMMCQRCTQPNLQLPGGIELNGSRLFRDRMYEQHGLIPPVTRQKHSGERRGPQDLLIAYVIDNKRFTEDDRKEIAAAIDEINHYTDIHLNKTDNATKLKWPLIRISYLYYHHVKRRNSSSPQFKATKIDSRPPAYELTENDFMAQLKLLRKIDIHVTGPGTGQMYQTFLSDGSVSINLGGIRPWAAEKTKRAYTSFLEQHVTAGTPYIKGLYYPINERQKGIQKDEVVNLVREAAELIINGFSLPINPKHNLAPDGQLFTEMCERDKNFCTMVTDRSGKGNFQCVDMWIEDFVHEYNQWRLGGFIDGGRNIICPFNRTLLHELRQKYNIKKFTNFMDVTTNKSVVNASQN